MLKKLLFWSLPVFLISAAAHADSLYSPTANFEPSVRASGMGGAYAGFDDDEFGHFYNPAISSKRNTVGLTYDNGIDKQNTGALAFTLPHLWRDFNLGMSAVYSDSGAYEFWDPVTMTFYDETLQRDWLAVLNVSKDFCYGIAAGANVKFLNSKIVDESASSMLFDIGALWRQKRFEIGASFQNFGGSLKYSNVKEDIANTFRVGGSVNFDVAKQLLIVGADFVKTQDNDASIRGGAEFLIEEAFAVRAGYNYSGDSNALATGFTLGAGYKTDSFKIDYAFVPYESAADGNEHKVGFAYMFGKTVEHVCYAHHGKCPKLFGSKEKKSEPEKAPEPIPAEAAAAAEPVKKEPVLRIITEKANDSEFKFDSYEVSDANKAKIKEVADLYKGDSVEVVRVEGHTDDAGTLEYNQKLSEKRAQAVADVLIAAGMDVYKIVVTGYGKERPIADNATETGAAQNRRVEIYIDELKEMKQ